MKFTMIKAVSMAKYENDDVVVVAALRTPIGTLNGSLSSLKASSLGSTLIESLLKSTAIQAKDISEIILGQALTAGQGQNPARQASINAGIPIEVTATSVNMLCGSGLKAIALGSQAIRCGDSKVVIAGGQESMSQAPHCVHMRNGVKFGDTSLKDTMLEDGLMDAINRIHMGITAENVAEKWNIPREVQDNFAVDSQNKTENAQKGGKFKDEIVPVMIKSRIGTHTIEKDEHPRNGTTVDKLQRLKPAFKNPGTVTAGNASGINDGAAAVMLMNYSTTKEHNLDEPMARVVAWAQAGVDPKIMGTGPIPAIREALRKANWSIDEVELFEINEAFAAQSLAVIQELGLDSSKVNVNGGAIALGHPIGASGSRIVVTLLHEMKRRNSEKGVAALCIGGVEIEKIYIKMMRYLVICFSVLISFSIIIILFPDRVLDGSMKVLKSHNTLSFLANILDFEERKAGKVSRCENFEKEVTKGYWKAKAGVTQKDVMERRKMDERIRVEMKWPARLHRNDSRCGKQYPIPGYRIQSLCDPDGENPCCNAGTGECGISVAHCNCSQCTDLREMKSADLMEWQTEKPECGIKNFSKNEVCDFLNKYNFKITFMGDSLIRHMITTMLLLITGDPQSGAIPANANKELYKICSGYLEQVNL
eukprot:Seg397.30 transcript_id=Seg397.30/GoldUCD/mRNA.D3Y31 product="Acetyl-CoA acetyltransferase" protein_id=Seg397.30/GoldUCD/D3Y31